MKGLSFLFKLTLYFKDVYTQLTETYGYPIWAVLTLFVIVTILIGLLLGVVFIVIIDFACPPKKASKDEIKETQVCSRFFA
jgi:phage shock protein PspC (stress-responsive transcriptional regulator)